VSLQSGGQFPQTRWSVVLAARGDDAHVAQAALTELCEIYWPPLYSFVRRRGKSPEDAEDLTQAFFSRLIEKDTFGAAQSKRGKLRSFLLKSMKNFLSDEWDKETTRKRGGGVRVVSIDLTLAEERYAVESSHVSSPDKIYDRRWALAVLDRVLSSLREHYRSKGKERMFEELHPYLAANSKGESYPAAAGILGMTTNAVRVAVYRMRQRYADELRSQIAETVDSEDEVAAEIDFLFRALR